MVSIDPVPAGKRFVVEYVSVLAYTDHASGQRLNVILTFFSGPSSNTRHLTIRMAAQISMSGERW